MKNSTTRLFDSLLSQMSIRCGVDAMDGGMEELGMPTLVQFARRPIVVIWYLALLAIAVALAALRLPPITSAALGGAVLVAALIALGDWMADWSARSPRRSFAHPTMPMAPPITKERRR